MSDITTSLNGFLSILDALQVVRKPLQPHALSRLPEPEKKLYATLLTMLVSNQPITENQVRLFSMLLISMGLEDDLQPLYANIKNIDKASVLEFCQMCDTHDLAISFLMDALTLCRLTNALSESQVKSISELVNLLRLDATDLAEVLHLSNVVLGERVTITEDSNEQIISSLSQLRLNFDYEKLTPWHEFGYQPIRDETQIKAGLEGGLWLIDKPLSLYSGVTLNNANILFIKQGSLSVDTKDFESVDNDEVIKINGCQMIGANISIVGSPPEASGGMNIFGGFGTVGPKPTPRNQKMSINDTAFVNSTVSCKDMGRLTVANTLFTSDKAHNFRQDYLILENVESLDLDGCWLTNCPQIALLFENNDKYSKYAIKNTLFSECGDIESHKAGAIYLNQSLDVREFIIKGCEFVDNRSNQGSDINIESGIWSGQLNIEDTRFINTNIELKPSIKSIFITRHMGSKTKGLLIVNSQFENTSLLVNYWGNSYPYRTFDRVTFKNTAVISNSIREDVIFDKCVFNNLNKPNLIEYKP